MGVTKQIIKQGDGQTYPKNGDNVTMEYTGWLEENGKKGKQ
jgi:FK506-binding protein 1